MPAESSPLSFEFFFSRDQVFRINVRGGDEISKLSQLLNSDNFKVPGPSLSPWVALTLVGEDSYTTSIIIPEEFLCLTMYQSTCLYMIGRVDGGEVLWITAALSWEMAGLSPGLRVSVCH